MRYYPYSKASPLRSAFFALFLALTIGACSATRSERHSTGVENDPVKFNDPTVSEIDKLQGRWRSRSDRSASIEIKGNRFLSLYNETIVSNGTLTFVNNCEERIHDPRGEYFIVSDDTDSLCYHLTVVEDTLLEYVYTPRGTTLSYERIQ